MITDAPTIKISGINYPVYSADFSWGGADKPSTLAVTFVNKNGIYQKPKLGTNNPVQIEIGDSFNFAGFPVTYTSSNSTKGKILSISYSDGSILLDKIFVGLKGVHGAAPPNTKDKKLSNTTAYGEFNSMILLGEYIDPCEGVSEDYIDPCNPCADITEYQSLANTNSQKFVDCKISRMTQFLDVVYSFNDLIAGLGSKGVVFYNLPKIKTKFYGRYVGSAREVLKSWCQDIGMTFVWHNNSIYFVDLKSGIEINDSSFYADCSLLESSESESIENTTSNGLILYFGAEGRVENYNCAFQPYKLSLIPITLKDLFWSGSGLMPYIKKYYTLPKTGQNSIVPLQITCMLSKYSKLIRDFVLMYEYYEVDKIDDDVKDKDMPLLGMKIKEAWQVGEAATTGNKPTLKSMYEEHVPASLRYLAEKMGAGMTIIEYNPEWHDKFYEFEKRLADDFVGRYWISYFSKGDKYTFDSPNGSPDYYDAGTPNVLPFIDFVPTSSRAVSTLIQSLVDDSAQKNKSASHVGAVETANVNTFASSFLLMDRKASWEPTEPYDDIRKMEEDLKSIYFYNSGPFKIEGEGDDLEKNEFYCLIFNKPETFDLIDEGIVDHPIEKQNENLRTTAGGYLTNYGLRSAACRAYQLNIRYSSNVEDVPNWNYNVNMYLPAQAHDTFGSSFPGITVIATNDSSKDSETKVLIEKQEVIFGKVPKSNSQSIALNIDYKDISGIISDILEETQKSCGYNVNTIKNLISEYFVNTSREKSVISVTKSYTIGGFPTRELTVLDGVSSISIRYSSTDGVTSSVSFSNLPPITANPALQDKEFQRNMIRRFVKKKMASSSERIVV